MSVILSVLSPPKEFRVEGEPIVTLASVLMAVALVR